MAVSEAHEYDPFAAFDDVVAGTTRDPWPALAEKRRTAPVSKGMMISPDVLPEGFDPTPEWIAYRYEDCSRILRDPKTFTSTGYDATIGMVMGHMILGMDDPEHRSHRNLVAHAFREKSLARWEPEYIAPIVDEMIDRSPPTARRIWCANSRSSSPCGSSPGCWGCPKRTSRSSTAWASS